MKSDLEKTVAELLKDKKVNEFTRKNKEEESEIDLFISANPTIFEWIENPKDLLKNELKKLADNIPMKDKLEDASSLFKMKHNTKISFSNTVSWWPKVINTISTTRNAWLAKMFWNKI